MRIQTFPRRFISRTMVRRAASIWRAVTQPGSNACKPYSPKLTSAPRKALPVIRPRICLRHLTRFGINIVVPLPKATGLYTWLFAHVHTFCCLCLFFSFRDSLALVDPHFDPELTIGGAGFGLGVVHVRAQCLQWNASIAQPHIAGHFGATQAAAHHDLDALCALAHRLLDRALHRTAI